VPHINPNFPRVKCSPQLGSAVNQGPTLVPSLFIHGVPAYSCKLAASSPLATHPFSSQLNLNTFPRFQVQFY